MTERPEPVSYRADVVVLAAEALVIAAAVVIGAALNHRGTPLHADAAPLYASWLPHAGPGTPLALAVATLVVYKGLQWARRLPWRALLPAAYLAAAAWMMSLALVAGWSRGFATRLTPQAEYLTDVPRVNGITDLLAGFSAFIIDFRPGAWATHVAGHPPGALLVFVALDRIGLGGGTWAALLCTLLAASAPVSIAIAVSRLDSRETARAALPYLVLFPGALWAGVSADGIFTAVVAAGLALLAARRWWAALPGGVLLGYALYLSYGLVLVGALALAVVALRRGARARAALAAALGAGAVVAAFTAGGFWWLTGYQLVVTRYYQGWAADRPYGYWVWANLACLALSAGPAVGPAVYRAATSVMRLRRASTVLPLVSLLAIGAADLSGLSKAEVERIWLPYTIWLLVAAACLPAAHRRRWLAVQALTALVVSHLLLTG